MSRWWLLLVVVASLGRAAAEESDVIELDEGSFQSGVADKDIVLVEFYAPWCGHCKRLAPEYEKAATALAKEDPPVPLAKVDCPANSALCGKYGVSGYPTLKIFRNGELSADYEGPRTADGIASYMRKQSGPSARVFDSVEGLRAFIDNEAHTVVGFFTDATSKLAKAFLSTADGLRDNFRFAYSSEQAVLEEYGYSDQVVIFQPPMQKSKLEDDRIVFDGDSTSSKIKNFVKNKFMGQAGVRTQDNAQFFESLRPLVVVYYNVDYAHNAKVSTYWRNRVLKVSKAFEDVTFAVSNKAEFARERQELGLGDDAEVSAGLFDDKGMKYPMDGKFGVEELRAFVEQFKNGELEPYVKSEPIPEDNDGPVTVVVGKNFDEIVNDEEKDVLIEFYAPWCGHCKALAPKWDELGEKLKDDPNVVIAKIDATANDYSSVFAVQGFPTIYWAPAGNKSKPEKYQGGREVSDFLDFLKKKATNPLNVAGGKKGKGKGKEEL